MISSGNVGTAEVEVGGSEGRIEDEGRVGVEGRAGVGGGLVSKLSDERLARVSAFRDIRSDDEWTTKIATNYVPSMVKLSLSSIQSSQVGQISVTGHTGDQQFIVSRGDVKDLPESE